MKFKILNKVSKLIDLEINKKTEDKYLNLSQEQKYKLSLRLQELYLFIYNKSLLIDNEEISISSKYLEKFDLEFTKTKDGIRPRFRAKELIMILFNSKLLINIGNHLAGVYSKSYTINRDLYYDLFEDFFDDIDIDEDLVYNNECKIDTNPKYKNLINNIKKVDLDIDQLYDYLMNNRNNVIKIDYNNGELEEIRLNVQKIQEYLIHALRFKTGKIFFTTGNTGRVYHTLSIMPSIVFNQLKLNNKELLSIDITNAQPLFLSLLIDNQSFKESCLEGRFYDDIVDYCHNNDIYTDYSKIEVRNVIKKLTFKYMLFDVIEPYKLKEEYKKSSKQIFFENIINNIFPNLINQIDELKLQSYYNYNTIAATLQIMESDIFVNEFTTEKKFFISKHDEIVCKMEDGDYFVKKIYELFDNKYGIKPPIKINK